MKNSIAGSGTSRTVDEIIISALYLACNIRAGIEGIRITAGCSKQDCIKCNLAYPWPNSTNTIGKGCTCNIGYKIVDKLTAIAGGSRTKLNAINPSGCTGIFNITDPVIYNIYQGGATV